MYCIQNPKLKQSSTQRKHWFVQTSHLHRTNLYRRRCYHWWVHNIWQHSLWSPLLCFQWCFDYPGSMRFPSYKCVSCFSRQHYNNSLIVWSIFPFVTGVQQHLSRIYPLLSSLCPMGFADSEYCQFASPHFHCYLTGLPNCPNVPCTYRVLLWLLKGASASWFPKDLGFHYEAL